MPNKVYLFKRVISVLAVSCAVAIACAGCKDASGRLNPAPTPKELAHARAALANVKEEDLEKDFAGGVMLEGRVLKRLPDDSSGRAVWLVRQDWFLLGKEQVSGDTVVLTSIATRDGGFQLGIGQKYRILTFNDDGHFMIWDLSAVEI